MHLNTELLLAACSAQQRVCARAVCVRVCVCVCVCHALEYRAAARCLQCAAKGLYKGCVCTCVCVCHALEYRAAACSLCTHNQRAQADVCTLVATASSCCCVPCGKPLNMRTQHTQRHERYASCHTHIHTHTTCGVELHAAACTVCKLSHTHTHTHTTCGVELHAAA